MTTLSPMTYRRALLAAADAVKIDPELLEAHSRVPILTQARFGIWAALAGHGYTMGAIARCAKRDLSTIKSGVSKVRHQKAEAAAYTAMDAANAILAMSTDDATQKVAHVPRSAEPRTGKFLCAPLPPEEVRFDGPLPKNPRARVEEEMRRQQELRALIERENERLGI